MTSGKKTKTVHKTGLDNTGIADTPRSGTVLVHLDKSKGAMDMIRVAMIVVLICMVTVVFGQGPVPPRKIVDFHTAGVLPKAHFDLETSMYPNGNPESPGSGLTATISVGITNRFNIGLGFGGDGIIGRDAPTWNPRVGFLVKFRIVEENFILPALSLGYDHQGTGGIDPDYNGYVYKSPGFFLAASKNYLLFSSVQLGLHGGINFSFEDYNDIHWPNGYCGVDIGLNDELALLAEYDMALNQNNNQNPLHGYLNLGVRWAFTPSLQIEFDAKDIFEQKIRINEPLHPRTGWSRQLKITYVVDFLKS